MNTSDWVGQCPGAHGFLRDCSVNSSRSSPGDKWNGAGVTFIDSTAAKNGDIVINDGSAPEQELLIAHPTAAVGAGRMVVNVASGRTQ